jgi:hypothetical protein
MNGQQVNYSFPDPHPQFQQGAECFTPLAEGIDPSLATQSGEIFRTMEGQTQNANMRLSIEPSNWSRTAAMVSLLQQWPQRADFETVYGKEMFDAFIAAVDRVTVSLGLR